MRPRRLVAGLGLASLIAQVAVGGVAAAGIITVKPLGAFAAGDTVGYPLGHTFRPEIPPGSSVATYLVRFPPGTEYPFRHHGSAAVATVATGTLTIQDAATCATQTFGPGEGFVEEPGVTHRAVNPGPGLATLYVTYLGVAPGESEDMIEEPSCDPC